MAPLDRRIMIINSKRENTKYWLGYGCALTARGRCTICSKFSTFIRNAYATDLILIYFFVAKFNHPVILKSYFYIWFYPQFKHPDIILGLTWPIHFLANTMHLIMPYYIKLYSSYFCPCFITKLDLTPPYLLILPFLLIFNWYSAMWPDFIFRVCGTPTANVNVAIICLCSLFCVHTLYSTFTIHTPHPHLPQYA